MAGFFKFGWLWGPAMLAGVIAVQWPLALLRARWQGKEPGEAILTGLLGLALGAAGWWL